MWNVITFEVSRALKKKSFWIASLVPLLAILGVFGIIYSSARTSQSTSAEQAQAASESSRIAALDDSGLVSPQLLAADHVISEPTEAAGIADVASGKLGAFIYYPAEVSTAGIQVYSQDQGVGQTPYNDLAANLLRESVVASVSAAVSSTQAVRILQGDPPVSVTTYKNGAQTPGVAAIIAPGLFLAAFMLFFILLGPIIISSTSEEKENRVAEILLTSVKTGDLIGGKAISIIILGVVQGAVIMVPTILAALRYPALVPGGISLGRIPLDPVAITIGALFLVAGFTLFTGLIMGAGSMVPGTNTANRFMGVFVIWIYVPIWALSLIITAPRSAEVAILTYFPLTAPTTVLLRNALGTLSPGEAAVSFVILAATAVLAIWFAIRAFRYGSMEHGRRIGIRELLH
ncbi:MAG TPA: ABC transporter permease [Candidatus Paceibacterota bacterium]|nr:ABC transporter permease [Candidatus Paceibacterota bacterium]